MLTRLSATVVAFYLLLGSMASAAPLSSLSSSLVFRGDITDYFIDILGGTGYAFGLTDDGNQDLFLSGAFDAGTPGQNPTNVVLSLTDLTAIDTTLDARSLEDIEVGSGYLALLFGDLIGTAAPQFTGGKLLAILGDPAFPAISGTGTFELRSLDDLGVIPLPAAAPLLLSGLGALAVAARRRRAKCQLG